MKRQVILAAGAICLAAMPVAARITHIEISKIEPAFGGGSFGAVGAFERHIGKAYGEVDPRSAANRLIQDIELAPRNARGMVEYSTDIEILRPKDLSKGNGVQLVTVVNRGNKTFLERFNADLAPSAQDLNDLKGAGDGYIQKEGYTVVYFGWQADVLPGTSRMTFKTPAAVNRDGTPVTGIVRSELTTSATTKTLNLSSGWFTTLITDSYPVASLDNKTPGPDGFLPTLSVRAKENAPRVIIPNTSWSFGACPEGAAVSPEPKKICFPAGFQPGRLYEVIYKAKDPLVMGLGLAAMRDLGAFLKTKEKDEKGNANPAYVRNAKSITIGSSQSGRFIRQFIHLGFNRSETGGKVFDGAYPHIGGGLIPISLRFAQPGRAWGDQVDHLYPAYDFPFTYTRIKDPLTGRTQGILDRCSANNSCPKIFHVATALEVWEGRQSLGLTDPLGARDIADPLNVRTFIMASTQHGSAPLPLPAKAPFNNCVQQPNPNPQLWTMRALLKAHTAWVRDNVAPPPSAVPRVADGTLVAPDRVMFPEIPANKYAGVERPAVRFLANYNPLHVLDFGKDYNAADGTGVITREPPGVSTAQYGILVPQVDKDGIDIGGIRSVMLGAPIGTYTAWNVFRQDRFEDGFCNFQGTFVPFAATKAEREENKDPRPSLEERYPTNAAYVTAIKAAADKLTAARFLLPEDNKRLVEEAQRDGVRKAP